LHNLHLLGPGHVGRRLLRRTASLPLRIVAVSDSTATVFDREGLDPETIAAHKQAGGSLRELAGSRAVSTPEAIDMVHADVVVDATQSNPDDTTDALARGRSALKNGAFLVLGGKNALATAASEWLLGGHRVGINAVLGGTGRQLLRELHELRARCTEVELCGNVTTTVIVQAIERGASLEEGIAHARSLGILESDPALDLDGIDAAVKLLAVAGAIFGTRDRPAPSLARVHRQSIGSLNTAVVRERPQRGATTRLVARADRRGRLGVRFEELAQSSPLVMSADQVAYGYRLGDELRMHSGRGVGYDLTAAALLEDLRDLQMPGPGNSK